MLSGGSHGWAAHFKEVDEIMRILWAFVGILALAGAALSGLVARKMSAMKSETARARSL